MDEPDDPTLGSLLAEVIPELGDLDPSSGEEFARGGVTFAARVGPDAIELRLGDEIAEAAMRTPDTGPSSRGAGWVRFAPAAWDEHAFDRLEAWLLVAWRLAASRRSGT